MKRITSILVCLVVFGMSIFGQNIQITGTITSADDGSMLPGVTVVVKGDPSTGTITDVDGNYEISAPADATLVFSYIGMEPQEVLIGGQTTIDVVMKSSVTGMDEIVVVAYGTQKKSEITGAVATVKSEELETVQSGNVLQGIEGKLTGVQIIQGSGQPGDAPSIRVRGIGSISGSSAPLYVVDGVPFQGNISSIDQSDIQSINVLKDASANALYGHRGANGVVIITTKKGQKNSMKITADLSAGVISRGVPEYDILTDPAQYYETHYSALRNFLYAGGATLDSASTYAARNIITDYDKYSAPLGYNNYNVADDQVIDPTTGKVRASAKLLYNEDWNDFLYKNDALKSRAFLSMSGGTDKTTYFISLGYDQNEGYAINSGFDRLSSRVNIDHEVNKYIKVGGALNYSHTDQDAPVQGYTSGNYANLFNWSRIVAPIYPVMAYDSLGNVKLDDNGEKIYDFGNGQSGSEVDSLAWKRTLGGPQNPYA
ncbi:MAG: SusC/RagA family TonB-linked outer membrane protein, partial [Bacteroidales bacterium]|nr:SusC/RagA family TonB-linked outer membrane protein [Bacteroidales bacterium]